MRLPTLAALSLAACVTNAAPHAQHRSQRTVKRADVGDGTSVMTFYGQSTEPTELYEVCENANFDIIILAFITSLNPPKLNMGKDTGSPSAAQEKEKEKGFELFDGTFAPDGGKSIATQISDCQVKGKKVMISFGGDERYSNATFGSEDEAKEAADQVWYVVVKSR